MEQTDVLVVGAGVVGLAVADRLASGSEVVVVERHDGFGRETSSRNSEVIHAGLYYGEELLKTRLCVRGNPLLYERCARHGIPHRKTQKIVVATAPQEEEPLRAILAQAARNGVPGVRLIGREEIRRLEPQAEGRLGLLSPQTGIVDSHALMAHLEAAAKGKGTTVAYNAEVTGVRRMPGGYEVEVRDADGGRLLLRASALVNSAGLQADRLAALAGIDVDAAGYRIHPCKGEYFRVADRHRGRLTRLVYPLPSPVHLGAHAVLQLDGRLKVGPSSFYVESLDYTVDPAHARDFYEQAHPFLPFLSLEDLSPDQSGIRPKLYGPGEPLRDWVIREESDRGLPGLVNLVGMESPALTSCLAIAEEVARLLERG